jgi:hypothetical protein
VLLEPGLELPGMAPIPVRILRKRIRATLACIGKDGFGVRVSQDAASQLLAGVWFRCEFRDSENLPPVRLAARITHARPTLDGSYYVGLAFQCPNELEGSSVPRMPREMRVDLLTRGSQKKS